jgi:DNA-directed RNA polymerase subunit beta
MWSAGPRFTKQSSSGDDTFEAGIPESFNVLVKEMRSLGLNVELSSIDTGDDDDDFAEAAE